VKAGKKTGTPLLYICGTTASAGDWMIAEKSEISIIWFEKEQLSLYFHLEITTVITLFFFL